MKYEEIRCMAPINDVDDDKATEIAESMRKNGYVGCPILVYGEELLTGSHRIAALAMLADDDDLDLADEVMEWEVAEDVTDIVEEKMHEYYEENGEYPEIDPSDIGWIFEGSWVEAYKDQIVEW